MKQGSRWVEELLVLYERPEKRAAVSGWRPFNKGDTLEEIITTHNLRCQEVISQNIPPQLASCAKTVWPTLKITWSDINDLQSRGLARPTILMVDLGAIQGDEAKLLPYRDVLSQQRRLLHLVQVSQSSSAESLAPFFEGPFLEGSACIIVTGDEIYKRQADFEAFLVVFCQVLGDVWSGIARNPFDRPCQTGAYTEPYVHPRHGNFINPMSEEGEAIRRVYLAYHDALPALAARARDVALARSLSSRQVNNLGRSAAIQELLLALVAEKARRRPVYPVSVQAIRKSLFNMPTDKPFELNQLQEVDLVAVHLPQVRLQPTSDECEALEGLGLAKGAFAAVHYDRLDLWEQLERLGDTVMPETFTIELPGWETASSPCDVGLNETSFGVRIEESFSRRLDQGYIREEASID